MASIPYFNTMQFRLNCGSLEMTSLYKKTMSRLSEPRYTWSSMDVCTMAHTRSPNTTASAWILECLKDIFSSISAHQLKLAIRPLQMIQSAAALLVFNLPKFSNNSPLLLLHWLPVAAHIRFKTLIFPYKANNGPPPFYLKDLITPHTAPHCLRSSSTAPLVPPSLRGRGPVSRKIPKLCLKSIPQPEELTCTSEELTCTSEEFTCTSEELTCTSEELTCTSEELTCTSEELTCTSEELTCTSEELTCTSEELTCTSEELTCTSEELTCTSEDLYLRGTDLYLRGTDLYLRRANVYLRGVDLYLRGTDLYLRRANVYLRGVDLYLRGTDLYLRGPDLYLRTADPYLGRNYLYPRIADMYLRRTDRYLKKAELYPGRAKLYLRRTDLYLRSAAFHFQLHI
ncbi:hypothetical protein C0J45_12341 [Silurus meridionalis]|nr:hypothetical protein C0J45_12341 [Silurus meridionalis]